MILSLRKTCSKKIRFYLFGVKIFSIKAFKRAFCKPELSPKFGVSYSVFDGEELLEASIRSIRSQVDYVNVVYQTTSWRGNPANSSLLKDLKKIQDKGLIDEIIFFVPDLKKTPQYNEINKRNLGLKAAIEAGVNYFMPMDVDEFYFEKELEEVKKFIVKNGITHSYCAQVAYGSKPTLMKLNDHSSFIQFFSKVDKFSQLGDNQYAPCLVDPTRMLLEREKSKHRVLHQILMHHMSCVRKNLSKKFANSSFDFKDVHPDVLASRASDLSHSRQKFVEVKDYFELSELGDIL